MIIGGHDATIKPGSDQDRYQTLLVRIVGLNWTPVTHKNEEGWEEASAIVEGECPVCRRHGRPVRHKHGIPLQTDFGVATHRAAHCIVDSPLTKDGYLIVLDPNAKHFHEPGVRLFRQAKKKRGVR